MNALDVKPPRTIPTASAEIAIEEIAVIAPITPLTTSQAKLSAEC